MRRVRVAFSGSGFRFFTHIGALSYFDETSIITELAGTSGGSLIAALYAIDPDIHKLQGLMNEFETSKLVEFDFSALFNMGFCKGRYLERCLKKVFGSKTLKETKIPLSIAATDLNTGTPKYFSTYGTPDVLIWQAIRASCSVPFLYVPCKLNGNYYVDGGIVNNIPINLLVDTEDTDIYAINLVSEQKHFFSEPRAAPSIFMRLIDIMMQAHSQTRLDAAMVKYPGAHIINIDTSKILHHRDTDIDSIERTGLLRLGYNSVKNYDREVSDAGLLDS
jgi:NTE family protein